METIERAKRTKVRAVSKRPGTGPTPPPPKGRCSKRIILTSEATARKRAKTAMRALVVMMLRRSAAIR